jgi:hypothetical protein
MGRRLNLSMFALPAALALPLLFGCASTGGLPFWGQRSSTEDSPASQLYPKAAVPQRTAPQGAPYPHAEPVKTSDNAADLQRQQAINEQLAKYQRFQRAETPQHPTPEAIVATLPVEGAPSTASSEGAPATSLTAAEKPGEDPQVGAPATPAAAAAPAEVKQASATSEDALPTDSEVVAAVAEKLTAKETSEPEPESGESPKYQSGDWQKQQARLIESLREEIALAKATPSRSEDVHRLEAILRLQYALAGDREEAARPIEAMRESEQSFWQYVSFAIVDLVGPERLTSESRRFAVAIKSLEEAAAHLSAPSSLTLRSLALCRKVQDFGVVERFSRNDFTRNQEVLLYVEVGNFAASKSGDHTYETELQGSFRVLDRSGAAVAERTLPLDRQASANLRRDYYIAYRLYIPSELPPGAYMLELTIEDKKGNKSNNALLDFNVVP